jgi:hypothetical protein
LGRLGKEQVTNRRDIAICQADRTLKVVTFRSASGNLMGLQHPMFFGWREVPVDNICEALGKFKGSTRRKEESYPGLGRLLGIVE